MELPPHVDKVAGPAMAGTSERFVQPVVAVVDRNALV